ncbi:MAG: PAS domain S-box protein [Alphaproteobacteria bacterium]|nr:PAS domain S-box protein [Alphaproteobacteria bacterium]
MSQSSGTSPGLDRSALLEAMEGTSNDAIITIDDRGLMQSFNPAAERLFGYAQDEVIGRNVKMLMPENFRADHDRYIANYLETGVKKIIGIGRVVLGEKKDGSTFPIELAVGESKIDGRSIFVGFIRDLTDIQTEQRRVQELQRELFHVSRLGEMGQLVSGLAHEVNQPLAAIMNYLQVAQQMAENLPSADSNPIPGVLEKVEAQAKRAADIVKRLRAFIDRREVERKSENVATLIEESLALGMVAKAGRGPRVRLDIEAGIPNVLVDRVQIQQVVVNLVRNAIDAMASSPRRELTITAEAASTDTVRIAVSDTGPGIAPEIADRLFGAFVTTKPEGMGVGLSICRSIIEGHGGRISCEPNTGGGTTFAFTLPLEQRTDG